MSRVLLSIVIATFLYANDKAKVEVLAKSVVENESLITASGDVILKDKDTLFLSDSVKFNRENNQTTFEKDFFLFDKSDRVIKAKNGCYNLSAKSGDFNSSIVIENRDNVWIKSDKIKIAKEKYRVKDGSFSSCDVSDPDWKITFSEGYYNHDEKFLKIYHAILYANSVPILYLPYFHFATQRQTGFLLPKLGNIENEGLFYAQPFYYAPSINWDLELTPQVRTRRGQGIFSTFRFVDTLHSKGEITVGGFWEKSKYYNKYGLANDKHLGFEIDYFNTKLFSNQDTKDGLLIDILAFNDTEYINTQPNKSSVDKLVSSKINYFYELDNHYFGAYGKYFIDTSKKSNDTTMQYIPSLQYHKYSNSVFFDNLLYSIDTRAINYYRRDGLNANQFIFNLPVGIHFSLLQDYLNLSISQNIYSTFIDYTKMNNSFKSGEYTQTNTYLSLSTNLAKKYEEFFHTMNFNFYYIIPGYSNTDGYFPDFVDVKRERESLNSKFTQVFYNNNGVDFLTHSFNQPYFFDNKNEKFGDFEHELKVRFTNDLRASNTFFFSHDKDKLTKSQTTLDYTPELFNLSLSHTYEIQNSTIPKFISGKIETKFNSIENYFFKVDYNLKSEKVKLFQLGYKVDKKCWRYSLSYEQERVPTLLESGTKASIKNGIFFNVELKPVGETRFRYQKENFRK